MDDDIKPNIPEPQPVVENPEFQAAPKKPSRWPLIIVLVILLALLGSGLTWLLMRKPATKPATSTTGNMDSKNTVPEQTLQTGELRLDITKDYGNKYANGLLPVGDKKYTTDAGKKGYIYICNANFVPENQAGAQARGPWFVNNNTQWDINKKAAIQGNVKWQSSFSNTITSSTRSIVTNDLPNHITGTFPVSSSDPAYGYDRNPNSIKAQSLSYNLEARPTFGTPQCVSGEVGVMLTGVALFNGFDAGGRDAGAWEVQDSCDGHPQNKGEYHYHTLSRCITDASVRTVIGFALDGFPITGPKVGDNNFLTTDYLDECHGITSEIVLDGKTITSYHYVMTQDFPYSVSCFRSTAIKAPGLPENTDNNQQSLPPRQH
jgi:hypothetical protein